MEMFMVQLPRVPDALRHSSCRCAEPGPRLSKQAGPGLCSAPLREGLRAALRPGHGRIAHTPAALDLRDAMPLLGPETARDTRASGSERLHGTAARRQDHRP